MFTRYEPAEFESKWQGLWKEADLFRTREDAGRPKFYGLDFFPYPSGAGLSVGHCRNYIPTDVLCRMKFMQGFNVLHPMGFDAFGLPAENEAIKRQSHPAPMIEKYGENYRRQMDLVGVGYDWSRSFYSCEPSYYKWTQWIFTKLYEKGLAFRKSASVNWCPKDKTVLADEEVVGGNCERCGTPVEKKFIPQWFFRITDYAQRLIDDLDDLDWPEGIKNQQRNWIGRSDGVEFELKITGPGIPLKPEPVDLSSAEPILGPLTFRVFTTRIDTIFGMTFCVLAPEHPIVERLLKLASDDRRTAMTTYRETAKALGESQRQVEGREKTGVDTGFMAINPATGKGVPLFLADYVLTGYGTGAIMAVPGHDQRDFDFAKTLGAEVVAVIAPTVESESLVVGLHENGEAFEAKDGVLINSGEYTGKTVAVAQAELGEWIEALGIGIRKINYRLRDWLISRQRYWGCPIPVIHDADGLEELVPLGHLPVELPVVENYEPAGDGTSPLASIPEFVNVTDSSGRLGRRETDTMGGFACSSWYFLRFCDPHNSEAAWNPEKVNYWMPVDCYVGGAEHAVMHLLYARFWTKVLFDLGLVAAKEPFQRLMNQGQVLGNTPYRKPTASETLGVGEEGILVSFEEAATLPKEDVTWKWVRMSKSKGNVVTPDEAVAEYGADALRIYELFVAPFDADVQWSNEGMQGSVRFLSRVFKLVSDHAPDYDPMWASKIGDQVSPLRRATHQLIKRVTEDVERFAFNTSIAGFMIYLNTLADLRAAGELSKVEMSEGVESMILLLAPFAPHCADELWAGLGQEGFTYLCEWPQFVEEFTVEDTVTIAVQVNGKLRDTFEVGAGVASEELEKLALALPKVAVHTEGKTIRKVIVIPGKLVNVVAN
ncbi:MAG: leucine--tRNA ligase [Armatimonadetes bacterium]|nr:leucine--tRNA ligase [Armatimonadota bacterium]